MRHHTLLLVLLTGCVHRAPSADLVMANTVREAFIRAWTAYERYATGHDELRPLSHGVYDWYGKSIAMTPVDAYDTMLLMHLDSLAARAKQMILAQVNFDQDTSVQVFEMTIRELGGLITAYQMDGDQRFLVLARDLGNRMLPAFHSRTGMPYRFVNLRTGEVKGPVSNPAEIGTLMLEWGTLSKLTGDPRYYDAAKVALIVLCEHASKIDLVGSTINVETGEWVDRDSHVSGGIDSYYEYLLKSWRLFGDQDFKLSWDLSIAAANRYLAEQKPTGFWYGHADMDTGRRGVTRSGALDAFLPAVLALGGDLQRARRLMESVFKMWTTFGIEPEELDYVTMQVVDSGYALRPEAIESAYYLYHYTGDKRYQQMGRVMTDSILHYTRTPDAFTVLRNVVTKQQGDRMHSFFLAETLKYAYLLFAPPGTLDFDAVTFNTEAHPVWRRW